MNMISVEQWWRSNKFFSDWEFRNNTLDNQSFQWFKKNRRIIDRVFCFSLTKCCNRDEDAIRFNHRHLMKWIDVCDRNEISTAFE